MTSAPDNGRDRVAYYLLLTAGVCLLVVAVFHFAGYAAASLAVANSGLTPFFKQSFRALWLGFSFQSLLVAGIVLLAAFRPRAISKPVVMIGGLLQILDAALFFWYLESTVVPVILALAALCIVIGVAITPDKPPTPPA